MKVAYAPLIAFGLRGVPECFSNGCRRKELERERWDRMGMVRGFWSDSMGLGRHVLRTGAIVEVKGVGVASERTREGWERNENLEIGRKVLMSRRLDLCLPVGRMMSTWCMNYCAGTCIGECREATEGNSLPRLNPLYPSAR